MEYKPNHNKHHTIWSDLDGTLWRHQGDFQRMIDRPMELLPGVFEKLEEWNKEGHLVILCTARPEATRPITMWQLHQCGVIYKFHYDQLMMDVNAGKRFMLNDAKPDMPDTAEGIILPRNSGFEGLNI